MCEQAAGLGYTVVADQVSGGLMVERLPYFVTHAWFRVSWTEYGQVPRSWPTTC